MRNEKNNDRNNERNNRPAPGGNAAGAANGGKGQAKPAGERGGREFRPKNFNNNTTPQNNNNRKNERGGREKPQNNGGRDKNNAEPNRKDTYVYALDGNLYVNLTNRCSNGCLFCVRNERASYYGNYLWLRHGDPTPEKVIAAINGMGELSKFKEVVFCGFGEPTYKIAEMIAVADYVHSKGGVMRLNTNGQGNLINKRDVTGELKGKIDKINISLNASSAEKYQPICRSMFGEAGYTAMLDFARLCKKNGIECWFSVVDCIGEEEVAACKRVADSVGIPLRVRAYIADS